MTKRDWLERRYRTESERQLRFSTVSDMEVEPVYTGDDLPPDAGERVGLPGEFPYTRGVYPSMYRGRLWTMRQFAGFGTAEDTNARFRFLLDHGQTGLSTAFDMPTLMGYDADHPRAEGEVGRAQARPLDRRLRTASLLLLQPPQRLPGGGREAPRGPPPVGDDHARPLRRARPALAPAPYPRADRGGLLDRAAAAQQRRPGD